MTVEVDDTHVGGRERNKHRIKRAKLCFTRRRLMLGLWSGFLVAAAAGLLICIQRGALAAESAGLELLAQGLDAPANFVSVPASNRILLLEQRSGLVRLYENGQLREDPLVDLGDRLGTDLSHEEGLLGIAIPEGRPRELYLTYAAPDQPLTLIRLTISEEWTGVVENSEEQLLTVDRRSAWHACGHTVFGPDGLLYLCIGDTGESEDAQAVSELRGSIVRIDVGSAGRPYAIPADNPFTNEPTARPEIWMYGLRNPWRFSFDARSRHALIPDVGWKEWEELNVVDIAHSGANFGWPLAEGNECVARDPADCMKDALVWPALEYHHARSNPIRCSIIGGMVYDGIRSPDWRGVYVFGDFCSGEIWAVRGLFGPNRQIRKLLTAAITPSAIGPGPDGEIIVSDVTGGSLYRLRLPTDFEEAWQSLAEFHDDTVTEARRSGDVALIGFLDDRVHLYRPPHIGIRQPPSLETVLRWHDALGRPSMWQLISVAGGVAVLGLAVVISLTWLTFQRLARRRLTGQGGSGQASGPHQEV